jgi:NitT/TauT family transport system ATP-binding protein
MITHNIEEAMLMSDHIIVMSGRPGRIILEREGFPSTEHGEDASSQPEYLRLKKNILSALRDEIS